MPQIATVMIVVGIMRPSNIEYTHFENGPDPLEQRSGPLVRIQLAGQKPPDVSSYRIMVTI
jgi:hypothetical protein